MERAVRDVDHACKVVRKLERELAEMMEGGQAKSDARRWRLEHDISIAKRKLEAACVKGSLVCGLKMSVTL